MADYVTDTHGLLWYFTYPQRLGLQAAAAFAEVDAGNANLFVPVIVLAEIIFAIESGRFQAQFDPMLSGLQAISNVRIVDLSLARTLDLRTLTAIPEMHDRMIVAEALARNATLITRDQAITASGLVKTVW